MRRRPSERKMRAPIPTEYEGVRYDSKSEAIFVRALSLAPDCLHVEGHPPGYIHPWDVFAECWHDDENQPNQLLLFEYKPLEPSDTYCQLLWERAAADPKCADKICIVAYGSPWHPVDSKSVYALRIVFHFETPQLSLARNLHLATSVTGIRDKDAMSGLNYRFDLRAGGLQQPGIALATNTARWPKR